jgi:hypothetical protein
LLSGGYLVNKVNEEWSEGWIGISAIAVVAAVTVGFVINTPRLRAIGMAAHAAPDGPVPQALAAQINDPVLVASVHALSMTSVGIAWNMATQPGTVGAFVAIVIFAGIGAASAIPLVQRQA